MSFNQNQRYGCWPGILIFVCLTEQSLLLAYVCVRVRISYGLWTYSECCFWSIKCLGFGFISFAMCQVFLANTFLMCLDGFWLFYCAFLCWWLCLPQMVRLGFFYFWCCIYFWFLHGYKTRSRKPNPLSIKQATPNKTHGGG